MKRNFYLTTRGGLKSSFFLFVVYDEVKNASYTVPVTVGKLYANLHSKVPYIQLIRYGDFAGPTILWTATSQTNVIYQNNKAVCTPKAGTKLFELYQNNIQYILGHVYFVTLTYNSNVVLSTVRLDGFSSSVHSVDNVQSGTFGYIATCENQGKLFDAYFYYNSFYTGNEIVEISNCMAFDLTDMFGTGNEPTTIQEFKEKYPKAYYPTNF